MVADDKLDFSSFVLSAGLANANLARMCGSAQDQQCPTTQSSTLDNFSSSYANDGHEDQSYSGYCQYSLYCFSHTADAPGSTNPWWLVDFGSLRAVGSGMVRGRTDSLEGESRLDGFEVYIGSNILGYNSTGNSRCYVDTTYQHDIPPYSQSFTCVGAGQYLYVVLPGDNRILTMVELEVYPLSGMCAGTGKKRVCVKHSVIE